MMPVIPQLTVVADHRLGVDGEGESLVSTRCMRSFAICWLTTYPYDFLPWNESEGHGGVRVPDEVESRIAHIRVRWSDGFAGRQNGAEAPERMDRSWDRGGP